MLKKRPFCLLAVIALLSFTTCIQPIYGMVPYETYFYDSYGEYFLSPEAYIPSEKIDAESMGLEGEQLNTPNDMVMDHEGNLYIADTGNNRILILDGSYQLKAIVDGFMNEEGNKETFNQPGGIYVSGEGTLYIADSKNHRIVILNEDKTLSRIIEAPSSEVLPEGFIYEPSALAVDPAQRIYVISKSTNMGVIALSPDGTFEGFVGAEKVEQKITELFWKLVTTKEQKRRTSKNVPTEYNNITIDDKGFTYVTTSAIDSRRQYDAMMSNEEGSRYAPIKKLNPAGIDVLRRNGSFGPAGDIEIEGGVSKFVDVALGPNDTYSTLDSTDNKIFTYDINGNLLYAFGGYGTQLGVFQNPVSLCYKGSDLLVLDLKTGCITVFSRTEYGDALAKALQLQNDRKYMEAANQWQHVLTMNSNFDLAYTGVADSYMRLELYEEAMDYYKLGNNPEGYQKAYTEYRRELIKEVFVLVPIGICLAAFLMTRLTRYIQKINKEGWRKKGQRTLKEELFYAYYIMFHPFDGFYDLKHEKRGSLKGASIIVGLVIFSYLFEQIAGGYIYFGTDWRKVSLIDALMTLGLPLLLWVISTWGLTTLMDGKGTMKEIFIATAYALTPLVLIGIPTTLLTNIVTSNEMQFITFFNSLSIGWALFLIFFGMLTTNAYTLGKNILTTGLSVIGMGFMAFLGILFINVIQQVLNFINTIAYEIMFRL